MNVFVCFFSHEVTCSLLLMENAKMQTTLIMGRRVPADSSRVWIGMLTTLFMAKTRKIPSTPVVWFFDFLSTTGCCGILPVENQNNIQKRWVTAPQSWQNASESVNFAGRSVRRSQLSCAKMSQLLRNLLLGRDEKIAKIAQKNKIGIERP